MSSAVFIAFYDALPDKPFSERTEEKISKGYCLSAFIGSFILHFLLVFLLENIIDIIIFTLCISVYIVIIFSKLWYRAWQSIQNGNARTTPGTAVGLMFIPIFNYYWVFHLSWGFAKDFNSYIDRNDIGVKKLSDILFISLAIWFTFSFIIIIFTSRTTYYIYLFIGFIIISIIIRSICNCINSIRNQFE